MPGTCRRSNFPLGSLRKRREKGYREASVLAVTASLIARGLVVDSCAVRSVIGRGDLVFRPLRRGRVQPDLQRVERRRQQLLFEHECVGLVEPATCLSPHTDPQGDGGLGRAGGDRVGRETASLDGPDSRKSVGALPPPRSLHEEQTIQISAFSFGGRTSLDLLLPQDPRSGSSTPTSFGASRRAPRKGRKRLSRNLRARVVDS
jgi:hypothetical protein